MRSVARLAAVHAALFGAMWLFAILVYTVAFATDIDAAFFAVDTVLIAALVYAVYRYRADLGFRALGDHRAAKLLAITLVGTAAVLAWQLRYDDRNGVWLDESHYLLTLREGRIIPDGLLPFNIRWLVPILGGPWNFLPVADMDAIKAINFGAFAVTAIGLVLLLVRLRIRLWIALAAPIVLLSSYLGVYGAHNRLVLDPSNYALFVMLAHTVIRREHAPLFGLVLFVDALNAEKAVYFIPIFAFVQLVQLPRPYRRADLVAALKLTLYVVGPTLLYFFVLSRYLSSSRLEANLCFENLHMMSFTDMGGAVTENVRQNGFRILWFPHGAFTIFALLGFVYCDRWMRPLVLLLIPIFTQALIACDTQRMIAYAFIVYVPLGFVYLSRALTDLPRALAIPLFVLVILLALAPHFLPLLLKSLHIGHSREILRMWLSGLDVAVTGAIVVLHFTLHVAAPPRTGIDLRS